MNIIVILILFLIIATIIVVVYFMYNKTDNKTDKNINNNSITEKITNIPIEKPRALAVDNSGNIFVANEDNKMYIIYYNTINPVDLNINSSTKKYIESPNDIIINNNFLYVTNNIGTGGNNPQGTVIRFNMMYNDGVISLLNPTPIVGVNKFINPYGIAADTQNNIYIVDSGSNNIKKKDSTDTFTNFNTTPIRSTDSNRPYGVTVDSIGNVYFTDNTRLCKIDLTTRAISNLSVNNPLNNSAKVGTVKIDKNNKAIYNGILDLYTPKFLLANLYIKIFKINKKIDNKNISVEKFILKAKFTPKNNPIFSKIKYL
jgi:sugar lactone lactonase YvrE